MILYYSFFLCSKTKNSEPFVNIEILTDSQDEQPIKNCLKQFIKDEKKKYGDKCISIPIIFTCDMSWPILKVTVRYFNNESIEEYIGRSYEIITGKASAKELPVKTSKLFVYLCLSHIMHDFLRYLKKFFTGNKKKLIMYCCSVLANSEKWQTFRKTIHCLFAVLLAIHKNSHFRQSFDEFRVKMKELGNRDHSGDCLVDHKDLKQITDYIKMVESFERLSEERYYQQSKRSQYYKDYHKEFQLVKEEIKSSSITSEKNDLYCLQYAGYILNNSTGLASLWSNIHLGCQSKHSREQSYLEWSKTFGNCDCVTNPPRT